MNERLLASLHGERVLVTGALGSIGLAVTEALFAAEIETTPTDLVSRLGSRPVDVRQSDVVAWAVDAVRPSVILHCAGAKHAPEGELDPWSVMETNAVGTRNVLDAARHVGARVVVASTGKAADPETAYGASKLIAERMTLNAGGSVARFFNVPESSGNVFRIWEQLPAEAPLPVTSCSRFFISLEQAVELLLWAAVLESGRYVADPGRPAWIDDVAEELYPGRPLVRIARRRGDRKVEPLHARSELIEPTGVEGVLRVVSPHDAALVGVERPAAVAA